MLGKATEDAPTAGAEGEHTSRQIINIDGRNVGTQYSRPQDEVSEEVKRSETSNQDDSVNKERRQNETSRNKEAKMGDFDNWDVTFDNQMRKWPLRGLLGDERGWGRGV